MALILLLLICLAAPYAVEPELYLASPPRALLHHARQAEARGNDTAALDYLSAIEARLLAGEGMPPSDAVSALALLGSLRLRWGDEAGAEAAFRLMAGRFPGQSPCPPCPDCPPPHQRHAPAPTTTNANTTATRQPNTNKTGARHLVPTPSPALLYAPFGVPQFAQHRPRAGVAWGGAQLVVGAMSVALFAHLATRKATIEDRGAWADLADRRQAADAWQQTQLTLQLPVTIAFYGLWAGSVAEARRYE